MPVLSAWGQPACVHCSSLMAGPDCVLVGGELLLLLLALHHVHQQLVSWAGSLAHTLDLEAQLPPQDAVHTLADSGKEEAGAPVQQQGV